MKEKNITKQNPNSTITILGCGSSSGVPTIETGWGNCNSNNTKNIRTRSSIHINIDGYDILIDTSPDFRQQALRNNIKKLNSVIYTHHHSDHINGIDDIRSINRLMKKPINCYFSQKTHNHMIETFSLAFRSLEDVEKQGFYRPCFIPNIISHNTEFILNNSNIKVKGFEHQHGKTKAFGYIFNNNFAYITDFSELSEEAIEAYSNLDLIIIAACTLKEHYAHTKFNKVIDLIKNTLKPKRAFLTHMSEQIDYETQSNNLKLINLNNIFLSYDGLQIKTFI